MHLFLATRSPIRHYAIKCNQVTKQEMCVYTKWTKVQHADYNACRWLVKERTGVRWLYLAEIV